MKIYLSLALCLLLQLGCALQVQYRHVYDSDLFKKDYIIGAQKEAFVGETIMFIKSHRGPLYSTMRPSSPYVISFAVSRHHRQYITGDLATQSMVIGETEMNGKPYTIIQFDPDHPFRGLINEFGWLHDELLNENNGKVGALVTIEPKNLAFAKAGKKHFYTKFNGISFSLTYGGMNGNALNLIYNEYANGNWIRSAFTKTFTYNIDSEYLQFRKIKIKLIKATGEKLVYKIIEDGLPT